MFKNLYYQFRRKLYMLHSVVTNVIALSPEEKSNLVIENLRHGGGRIGDGCIIWDTDHTFIDPTRPYLLTIGDYVKITRGVVILTHDYSLSVMRRVYGTWVGEGEETKIGNNCFLGMNSIILMGSQIGDNVIVGAGSVVHGCIPGNVVIAGNPAKVICTLEDHYYNRLKKTKEEAINCARLYMERNGRKPSPRELGGFKWLWMPRDEEYVRSYNMNFKALGDVGEEIKKCFMESEPTYWSNYEEFLEEVISQDVK